MTFRCLLLAGTLLASVAVAEAADPVGGVLDAPVRAVVAAGLSELSVIPAQVDGLLWAAWTEETENGRTLRLALLQRKGRTVSALWSVAHDGAYAPTLFVVPGWRDDGEPVVMAQYQLGAAYVHADFISFGADRRPRSLGAVEGALIEPVWIPGGEILKVRADADLRDPPDCFRWDEGVRRLVGGACP